MCGKCLRSFLPLLQRILVPVVVVVAPVISCLGLLVDDNLEEAVATILITTRGVDQVALTVETAVMRVAVTTISSFRGLAMMVTITN